MSAGAGADEQSRRHEKKVADLEAQLTAERRRQAAWAAGAEGERRVGAALEALSPAWRVVHDVHWPGRPKANLDHVAVGPTGIWVIDAKNWTGRVAVTGGVLRQNGYRRDECTDAAERAASAVVALLEPQHRLLVRAVVCLAGSGADLPVTASTSSTMVVGLAHLPGLLSTGHERLTTAEVITIARYLGRHLGGPTSPSQVTSAMVPSPADAFRREGGRVGHRRLPGPGRGASARTGPRPRTITSKGSARRPDARSRPASGCLARLLKTFVVITAFWLFLSLLPLLVPLVADLVSTTLTPALVPDAPTPSPGGAP